MDKIYVHNFKIIFKIIYYHSALLGTSGSNPNSSTGIRNSESFPSYALTICAWALLILLSLSYNYWIISFFIVSISSNKFVIFSFKKSNNTKYKDYPHL